MSHRSLFAWLSSTAASLIILAALPLVASDPAPGDPTLYYPTATAAAARIATLEAKLDRCKAHHSAAYEAAWELYGELLDCQEGLLHCEGEAAEAEPDERRIHTLGTPEP